MATRKRSSTTDEPDVLAHACARMMLEKKALDIRILDIRKLTDFAKYFVIGSATSDIHLKSVADAVVDGAAEEGIKPYKSEGWQNNQWIIIDYVDVVVHLLLSEAREFYNIEKIWADAVVTQVEE